MHHDAARRAFLTGTAKPEEGCLPPGAVAGFHDLCTQCGACAEACPAEIIYRGRDGYPVINPWAGTCSFCSQCAIACEPKAILATQGWDMRAVVTGDCLSLRGTTCRACEDQCDEAAIRFRLMTGGHAAPVIDIDSCTGCSACVSSCPAAAISLRKLSFKPEELPC